MIVYHGSSHIIESPRHGYGKVYNDYGQGFYCTESIEMAKQWACLDDCNGYANVYDLNMDGLRVLDLGDDNCHILNWLAILVDNRGVNINTSIAEQAKEYILDEFLLPYEDYDVIRGYRADDSYFMYAKEFLRNEIGIAELRDAMRLGRLGEQIVLKSRKAFNQITYIEAECVPSEIYYPKYRANDNKAREEYAAMNKSDIHSVFINDIIREGWKNTDERLY